MEIDDKTSATIQQSTSVAVLERISSSTLKSEAEIATKILKNTCEKKNFTTLERFISVFVEGFNHCNDTANKLKSENIRAIRLEKEFTTL